MGSDLTGFFSQPFIGPVFGMLCFFAILLLVTGLSIAAILYIAIRIRRKPEQKRPG